MVALARIFSRTLVLLVDMCYCKQKNKQGDDVEYLRDEHRLHLIIYHISMDTKASQTSFNGRHHIHLFA